MNKATTDQKSPYLKAGPVGGVLIRRVIKTFDEFEFSLPIDAHILIAVSGGADSVGLAHLVVHYGRKMVHPSQVTLLHINHQWRGKESEDDAHFVQELGKQWGVPVVVRKADPPRSGDGLSWEDEARKARKQIFLEESQRLGGARILTAHHADDAAETVLWRILSGAARTHAGGILFEVEREIRPFLKIRKQLIQKYLHEVGQTYREGQTNFSDRFLRARLRKNVMPQLEQIFPKAVDHLADLAAQLQVDSRKVRQGPIDPSNTTQDVEDGLPWGLLLQSFGVKARRRHLDLILDQARGLRSSVGSVHLPQGWRLSREDSGSSERWILQRDLGLGLPPRKKSGVNRKSSKT